MHFYMLRNGGLHSLIQRHLQQIVDILWYYRLLWCLFQIKESLHFVFEGFYSRRTGSRVNVNLFESREIQMKWILRACSLCNINGHVVLSEHRNTAEYMQLFTRWHVIYTSEIQSWPIAVTTWDMHIITRPLVYWHCSWLSAYWQGPLCCIFQVTLTTNWK